MAVFGGKQRWQDKKEALRLYGSQRGFSVDYLKAAGMRLA
jgi:hypothetical protein